MSICLDFNNQAMPKNLQNLLYYRKTSYATLPNYRGIIGAENPDSPGSFAFIAKKPAIIKIYGTTFRHMIQCKTSLFQESILHTFKIDKKQVFLLTLTKE